mgnify:CR=1 FL=1|tara:strand:- start:162063 stop:162506 length:444 start_codon:yes stop_codon:yes gene_type:complete
MQLRALKCVEYVDLYTLMRKEDFPDTPMSFDEAKQSFDNCICYGKFSEKGQLQAAFIFGDITLESAFVDIVCCHCLRGKWATKKTMKWLILTAFKYLDLDYVWINPRRPESVNLATKIGFEYVYGLDESCAVTMVLAKNKALKKYFK